MTFLNYFRRRRQQSQRAIFKFFDGQRMRSMDPLDIHVALELHESFAWHDGALVEAGDAQSIRTWADAVCDVFGVEPYDHATGKGLTGSERLAILEQYMEFCDQLKKNTSDTVISPTPTAPPSSPAAPSETDAINMNESSDST